MSDPSYEGMLFAMLRRRYDTPGAQRSPEQNASTTDLLRYLADSTDWLAHRGDGQAETAFDELEAIARLVESTVDTRDPGSYAGPCDICSLDMYARPGATIVRCRMCDVEYDLAPRRRKLLDKAKGKLATATDCARALTGVGVPVTAERIRQWVARGHLKPAGTDLQKKPLYRIRDVLDLLERPTTKTAGTGHKRSA